MLLMQYDILSHIFARHPFQGKYPGPDAKVTETWDTRHSIRPLAFVSAIDLSIAPYLGQSETVSSSMMGSFRLEYNEATRGKQKSAAA